MTTPHQLLLTLLDALNTHDPVRLRALFPPHFRGQDCAQPDMVVGPEGVWNTVQAYRVAFPDLKLEIIDLQIGEQGVTAYWTAYATHIGSWMNIPPTGREVTVQGIWMLTVENGTITHARSQWDVAGLLRELGLLPDL